MSGGPEAIMQVDCVVEGARPVVRVAGEIDVSSVEPLEHALTVARATASEVVLDLREVAFIDAAGLRVIAEAHLAGGGLVLREPSAAVRRLLDVTGLAHLLPVEGVGVAPSPVPGMTRLAYVRLIWERFAAGGAAALDGLVPDDTVWRPWTANGSDLRGPEELRAFWADHGTPRAVPLDFSEHPRGVVVRHHLPGAGGEVRELWSLYEFDGPKLVRAETFEDRAEALQRAA